MVSVLKILFTVAVIVVIYLGFKYRWRLTDMGRALARKGDGDSGGGGRRAPRRAASPPPPAIQDLVPCPRCGAYVAAGAACSCGKG